MAWPPSRRPHHRTTRANVVVARLLVLCALLAPVFAQSVPRPEYPEPQFEREQWQNLNGRWEFEFDDAEAGAKAHWESGARKFSRNITVPFCFESKMSGNADTAFHPNVWDPRTFPVPGPWTDQRVLLHFGAVNYW